MIKVEFTKSFFQIPLAKGSVPYLGTVTPFKGLRVYLHTAMGMPDLLESFQELISRNFGDFITEGSLTVIEDDLFISGNSEEEILRNYERVLQPIAENNLSPSAKKTVILPTILRWHWSSSIILPSKHKLSALATVQPPKTFSSMHGSFKVVSRCNTTVCVRVVTLGSRHQGPRGFSKYHLG